MTTPTGRNSQMALLKLENVTKAYGTTVALAGVSLTIAGGERVAIVGGSGSGKSTLMHILSTLDEGSSGKMWIDGECISDLWPPASPATGAAKLMRLPIDLYRRWIRESRNALWRRQIGFVFQSAWMLSNFDVASNIEMAAEIAERPRIDPSQLKKMLGELGLSQRADHTANELSGGERQRAAMGRALFHQPKLVFADEPTGNLDPALRAEMMALLMSLCRQRKAALVLVTHEPALAANHSDRVIGLKNGAVAWEQAGATVAQVDSFLHGRCQVKRVS